MNDAAGDIPCGLILSELMTNRLKHAFPDHRQAEVRASLRPQPDGQVRLCVSDNGSGLQRAGPLANRLHGSPASGPDASFTIIFGTLTTSGRQHASER